MQAELVERAQRGDRDAFASIAAASVDRCYALAYRILRDPHRAQDAAQQALLGAWRDLPSLRDAERFDAWLHRLVVNACYVEARGERRWTARVRVLSTAPETTPDFARSVAARDELERAFRRLSPEHRAVVVLHHHLGSSSPRSPRPSASRPAPPGHGCTTRSSSCARSSAKARPLRHRGSERHENDESVLRRPDRRLARGRPAGGAGPGP